MNRHIQAYAQQKQTRAEVMWQALERIIPDIRDRCEVKMVGTPLTHEGFLSRDRGSYGPAIQAGKAIFPDATTPVRGLLCCGDSTFPGIKEHQKINSPIFSSKPFPFPLLPAPLHPERLIIFLFGSPLVCPLSPQVV